MGATGLLKLAELTSCSAFGASKEFEAAAWSAASEAWRGTEVAGVYAAADSEDFDLPKIAMEKTKKLSGADRRIASIEKERLLRTDPKRLAAIESKVREYEDGSAIDRLASFSLPERRADAGLSDVSTTQTPSLTKALQFALETLGYVTFINGPDNDYGPTTQAAVARMTVGMTGEPRTTLTKAETRATICKAALKNDPVSLYHVALMYRNGWGFPQSDAKAATAIAKSETAMIAALGGERLPTWKEEAYKAYAGKIRAAAKEMKRADVPADEAICR
jgi:TPR repeat protein